MNARKMGGSDTAATEPATARPGRDAQPDRSQLKTPAQARGRPPVLGLQTAFKNLPRATWPPVSGRRCLIRARVGHQGSALHLDVILSPALPPAEVAPSDRITDPGTAPKLFNPAEGLNMEKTARAFFYPATKSFPIKEMQRTQKQLRDDRRKPMILRSYTLCEVNKGQRKNLPAPECRNQSNLLNRT